MNATEVTVMVVALLAAVAVAVYGMHRNKDADGNPFRTLTDHDMGVLYAYVCAEIARRQTVHVAAEAAAATERHHVEESR